MTHQAKSVRAFIGAKDYEISRAFYKNLGFKEVVISASMSYFKIFETMGFYLQKAYVKDWVDNTMLFVEVENVEEHWKQLQQLDLHNKYEGVRLSNIVHNDWGSECFLHDPSGILWHFGAFR